MTLLALTAITLPGCSTAMTLPPAISEYCQVGSGTYPITLSRKDTTETKRQVARANETYERLCKVKEPTNGSK